MPYSERRVHVLKEAKSICPVCFNEINAKVIEKNDKVYMVKECSKHGKFKGLIENDVEFYKKTMNEYPLRKKKRADLSIPFTHKCNLNCNFCWLPQRNRGDFSIEHLKKIISSSNCKEVKIGGGEPTLRDDLPHLIQFIKKCRKASVIMTNGLKLANLDYVKELKDAGLDRVCLSFNSFNDDIYKKLNGAKLLKLKLNVLENLKRVKIDTILSVMIVKGTNDKELKKIFDYCIENNSFIKELRIRRANPFGKFNESDTFFVSEMITIFSKILNIDKKQFIKIINRKENIPCFFSAQLISYKKDGYIYPWILFKKMNYGRIINRTVVALKILSKFKINTLFRLLINEMNGENNLALGLEFRSWPNKYNIDLEDIEKKCRTYQLSKNGEFPFCYSLILNNENIIEL